MRHIGHKLACILCSLGYVFITGCSDSSPKDANATCRQPTSLTGIHGHVMTSFGNGLGHMAPMALSAIPGMGGMGGGMAGMGMQQGMNRFDMDHNTQGLVSNTPLRNTEDEDIDPRTTPSVPCQPEGIIPPTIDNQDIKFGEEK